MMGGWWEQQCQDSSFQEVKSVSPLVSLRLFHMRAPAPHCLHSQSRGGPSRRPSDIWQGMCERKREREGVYTDSKKKDMLVHYFIYAAWRTPPSQPGKKLGLHGKAQGWLNVSMSVARGKKLEVETGWDKRLSFLLLKRSNMTYRGHVRDDEMGQRERNMKSHRDKGKAVRINVTAGTHL